MPQEGYPPPNGVAPLQDDPGEASWPQGVDLQPLLFVPVPSAPGSVVDVAVFDTRLQQPGLDAPVRPLDAPRQRPALIRYLDVESAAVRAQTSALVGRCPQLSVLDPQGLQTQRRTF